MSDEGIRVAPPEAIRIPSAHASGFKERDRQTRQIGNATPVQKGRLIGSDKTYLVQMPQRIATR
jgi:hypothetical protein